MERKLNIGVDADGVIFNLFLFQLEKGLRFYNKIDEDIIIDGHNINSISNLSQTERQDFLVKYVDEYCFKHHDKINIEKYDVHDIFNLKYSRLQQFLINYIENQYKNSQIMDNLAQKIKGMHIERQKFWLRYIYEYCMHSEVMDGFIETLKKWHEEGHSLYNITSRVYVDNTGPLGAIFRALLEKRYKNEGIEFDGIDYCSEKNSAIDKSLACHKRNLDFMIEDKEDNVNEISKITKVLCHDAQYNKSCKGENITRITNFKQADQIISEYNIQRNIKLADKDYIKNGKFKKLKPEQEAKLSKMELDDYYRQQKEYYKNASFDNECYKKIYRVDQLEKHELNYKIAYYLIIPLFKKIFNPQIINKDAIPYQKGVLFVSNHLTYLDHFTLICATGKRPIHFVAATELLKMWRGILYKRIGCLFVNRESATNMYKCLELSVNLLANDRDLFMFPEGGRNLKMDRYVKNNELKEGAVIAAQITGTPIIPFAINKNYKLFSKNLFVVTGQPIFVNPEDNIKEANERLKEAIQSLVWETMEKEKEVSQQEITKEKTLTKKIRKSLVELSSSFSSHL